MHLTIWCVIDGQSLAPERNIITVQRRFSWAHPIPRVGWSARRFPYNNGLFKYRYVSSQFLEISQAISKHFFFHSQERILGFILKYVLNPNSLRKNYFYLLLLFLIPYYFYFSELRRKTTEFISKPIITTPIKTYLQNYFFKTLNRITFTLVFKRALPAEIQ
jgi:hypothetical protein